MAQKKSVVSEARQIQLAVELINLGARLQVLEAETSLSRERLLRLYKEVKGMSPPKGMLPFSTDWFLTWQPNIHASLFTEIAHFLHKNAKADGIENTVKAYRLYLEHIDLNGLEPILTFTRAWTLRRFFDSRMLRTVECTRCEGHFVAHSLEIYDNYVCGLCAPPSRAGKTRKAANRAAEALAA